MSTPVVSKHPISINQQPLSPRVKLLIQSSAIAIVLVALSVLVGWQINNTVLISILPVFTPMNPITALCFTLIGAILLSRTFKHESRLIKFVGCGTASLIGLVGIAMIIFYATGYDTSVDRLLFTDKLSTNRMAPTTAMAFIATAYALILLILKKSRVWSIRSLTMIIFFISVFTIVAYAYGVQPIYGQSLYNPMALHTAILFLIISLTIFAITITNLKIFVSPVVILLYVTAITLFLGLSSISYRSFSNNFRTSANVQDLYADKATVSAFRTSLIDAETGQRGYLLTANPDFLKPYTPARKVVVNNLTQVLQVSDARINFKEKNELAQLTTKRLKLLDTIIAQYRDGQTSIALSEVKSGGGASIMNDIRSILDRFEARSNSELANKLADSKREYQKSLVTLSFTSAAILVLLLISLVLFQENLRRDSQKVLAAEKDADTATLYSEKLEREVQNRTADLEKSKASLERQVTERTSELNTELKSTQKMNNLMIDRELKMIELKKEITDLKSEKG